jgi:hypothetical protein
MSVSPRRISGVCPWFLACMACLFVPRHQHHVLHSLGTWLTHDRPATPLLAAVPPHHAIVPHEATLPLLCHPTLKVHCPHHHMCRSVQRWRELRLTLAPWFHGMGVTLNLGNIPPQGWTQPKLFSQLNTSPSEINPSYLSSIHPFNQCLIYAFI